METLDHPDQGGLNWEVVLIQKQYCTALWVVLFSRWNFISYFTYIYDNLYMTTIWQPVYDSLYMYMTICIWQPIYDNLYGNLYMTAYTCIWQPSYDNLYMTTFIWQPIYDNLYMTIYCIDTCMLSIQ